MTTYSAFFSSGLLATQHAATWATQENKSKDTLYAFCDPTYMGDAGHSPARPLSPMPLPDDSDIEIDTDTDTEQDRDVTPTRDMPHARSRSSTMSSINSSSSINANTKSTVSSSNQPRLRKRRSSLTVGTSPITAIRSPTRSAANAFNLQRLVPRKSISELFGNIGSGMPSSGFDNNTASQGTSLVGRLRSGSVGTAVMKTRRGIRRLASVPMPARAPPPTAPLPAIPDAAIGHNRGVSCSQITSRVASNTATGMPPTSFRMTSSTFNQSARNFFTRPPLSTNIDPNTPQDNSQKGRSRAFSVGGTYGTIDEEMKEN